MKNDQVILDLEKFTEIPVGTVFAQGLTTNDPRGAYMTSCRVGDKLRFVAKKGYGFDWAIYVGWEEKGFSYIETNGDKVSTDEYIQNIVPCTDNVLKLYRK